MEMQHTCEGCHYSNTSVSDSLHKYDTLGFPFSSAVRTGIMPINIVVSGLCRVTFKAVYQAKISQF